MNLNNIGAGKGDDGSIMFTDAFAKALSPWLSWTEICALVRSMSLPRLIRLCLILRKQG